MEENKILNFEELIAMVKENAETMKEVMKDIAELKEYVYSVNPSVKGFKKYVRKTAEGYEDCEDCYEDCRYTEDYFFCYFNKTKTLGGVHFDTAGRNFKSFIPLKDDKTLDGEYDIVLINDNSLGLIEVKDTVEKEDVEILVKKQVEKFKQLFPMYAKYKFYLGIGGLSFGEQAEDEAKKLGVAIFKLNGDAVEINDKNLKVY
ncbi:MAG: hypothetical protein FWF51_11080 [Chitinivibrionia bacterium]|nr:hypothetical protein [Chitinivibrionia bacterium]